MKWADKIHSNHILSKINEIDRSEVTNLSIDEEQENNSTIIHNLEEIKKQRKMIYSRALPEDSIDIRSDPEVKIPQKLSPSSLSNLETVLHHLGIFLEKLMEKPSSKEQNTLKNQKKKAWKETDSNI